MAKQDNMSPAAGHSENRKPCCSDLFFHLLPGHLAFAKNKVKKQRGVVRVHDPPVVDAALPLWEPGQVMQQLCNIAGVTREGGGR